MDAWMMVPGWVRGESTPLNKNVTLHTLIDHLVHICDLAGNTNHVGLGTDLDGGFGREQCPADMETIADLQKLPELLLKRGFSDEDIVKFCHQNWLDFLEKAWS
jgi:membrane dipeptidase